jgi:hypothetical protein
MSKRPTRLVRLVNWVTGQGFGVRCIHSCLVNPFSNNLESTFMRPLPWPDE